MYYISHRGNINGPIPERENKPDYILEALRLGYHCEIDLWKDSGQLFLGHDKPETPTDLTFLSHNKLWIHCKNIEALEECLKDGLHCFFHDQDDATLTSEHWIWTYPGKQLMRKSICVLPERGGAVSPDCAGICSDFIANYVRLY